MSLPDKLPTTNYRLPTKTAFTLIEVLVVLAIIVILTALGFYYFDRPKASSVASTTMLAVTLFQQRAEQFNAYEHRYPTMSAADANLNEVISGQPLLNKVKNSGTVYLEAIPELPVIEDNQACTNTEPNLGDHYYLNYQWYDPNAKATTTFPYAIKFCLPAGINGNNKAGYYLATPHQLIALGEGGPCQPNCNDTTNCWDKTDQKNTPPADGCGSYCTNPCHPDVQCACNWDNWGITDRSNATFSLHYWAIWSTNSGKYEPSDQCDLTYNSSTLRNLIISIQQKTFDQLDQLHPRQCAFYCHKNYHFVCDEQGCRCILPLPQYPDCTTTDATDILVLGDKIDFDETSRYHWYASSTFEQLWNSSLERYMPEATRLEHSDGTSPACGTEDHKDCCNFVCGRTWNWTTATQTSTAEDCLATRTRDCFGLPDYANYNSVNNITQNWTDENDSYDWRPGLTYTHSLVAGTGNCYFKCRAGYYYDITKNTCIASRQAACATSTLQSDWQATTQWNSTNTITQAYTSNTSDSDETAWSPATDTSYDTEAAADACHYVCKDEYDWVDGKCINEQTKVCSPNRPSYAVWWDDNCGNSQTCQVDQRYDYANKKWLPSNASYGATEPADNNTCAYHCAANYCFSDADYKTCTSTANDRWDTATTTADAAWDAPCTKDNCDGATATFYSVTRNWLTACADGNHMPGGGAATDTALINFPIPDDTDANAAWHKCNGTWTCQATSNTQQTCHCTEVNRKCIFSVPWSDQGAWGTNYLVKDVGCDDQCYVDKNDPNKPAHPNGAGGWYFGSGQNTQAVNFADLKQADNNRCCQWETHLAKNKTCYAHDYPKTCAVCLTPGFVASSDGTSTINYNARDVLWQRNVTNPSWSGCAMHQFWEGSGGDINNYGNFSVPAWPNKNSMGGDWTQFNTSSTCGRDSNGNTNNYCGRIVKNVISKACIDPTPGCGGAICDSAGCDTSGGFLTTAGSGNVAYYCYGDDASHVGEVIWNTAIPTTAIDNQSGLKSYLTYSTDNLNYLNNFKAGYFGPAASSPCNDANNSCGDMACTDALSGTTTLDTDGDGYGDANWYNTYVTARYTPEYQNGVCRDNPAKTADESDYCDWMIVPDVNQHYRWLGKTEKVNGEFSLQDIYGKNGGAGAQRTAHWLSDDPAHVMWTTGWFSNQTCNNGTITLERYGYELCVLCGNYGSNGCQGDNTTSSIKTVECINGNFDNCGPGKGKVEDPRDGTKYETFYDATAGECWLRSNLNYGQYINDCEGNCKAYDSSHTTCASRAMNSTSTCTLHSADRSINNFEKFCYGNDQSACAAAGGLYQLPTRDDRSLLDRFCPPGTTIAGDIDWSNLEQDYKKYGLTCDKDRSDQWQCDDAASTTKLRLSTGMNLSYVGISNVDGSFGYGGSNANTSIFWSKDYFDSGNLFFRSIGSAYPTKINRYHAPVNIGASIRCVVTNYYR